MVASDQEEIRNLVNRYFDSAWRQDVDAYVDTFLEDGEILFYGVAVPNRDSKPSTDGKAELATSPDNVLHFRGAAALRDMVATAFPLTNPMPFGSNHVIEMIDAASARGTIMVALHNGSDFTLNTIAYYRDEYAKGPKGWRLRRREVHAMAPGKHPITR